MVIGKCCFRTYGSIRKRRKATQEKTFGETGFRYISGTNGGKRLEILLEALPAEGQTAYYNQQGEFQASVINREQYTLSQRKKGGLRAQAVSQYNGVLLVL